MVGFECELCGENHKDRDPCMVSAEEVRDLYQFVLKHGELETSHEMENKWPWLVEDD